MSFIKELGEAIKNLAELEKLGIFCSMVIIVSLIAFNRTFSLTIILYLLGVIIIFLHSGIHKTSSNRFIPHPTNSKKTAKEYVEGYDFSSILYKKHPHNTLKRISNFFFIIGTISLLKDIYLMIK